MCWYIDNAELFASFKRDIDANYPNLIVLESDKIVHIKGTLRIKDEKNVVLGSYLIDIRVPDNFPKEMPELKEIGGEIPKNKDWHVNSNGIACLCYRDEGPLYWNDQSTIIDFINIFVEPFFRWQIKHRLDRNACDDAYSHGVDGGIEFYGNLLNTQDRTLIYNFVKYLTLKEIKGHHECYCGSGKIMRKCHFELLKRYRQCIKPELAKMTMADFDKNKTKFSIVQKNPYENFRRAIRRI